MLSQKGQEAAPFELLIAVITMTFVIVVGLNAMSTLLRAQCEGKIDQNMEELKTALETVAKGEGKKTVAYDMPSCFNQNDSSLRIVSRDDRATCSFHCGGLRYECTLLFFSSPDFSSIKCLNISSATDFPSATVCHDFDDQPTEFKVKEWKKDEAIEPGQYTLIKQFHLFSPQPRICVYKRV